MPPTLPPLLPTGANWVFITVSLSVPSRQPAHMKGPLWGGGRGAGTMKDAEGRVAGAEREVGVDRGETGREDETEEMREGEGGGPESSGAVNRVEGQREGEEDETGRTDPGLRKSQENKGGGRGTPTPTPSH